MKILLLEPFFTGSHQRWAEELQQASVHEIKILSLPGRNWKWRMHGGAISLARQFLTEGWSPDLILATDMLDLSSFLALTRHQLAKVPSILYFHENQLTYPWSASDQDVDLKRDRHYGFINLSSALVADAVWFNSSYHKEAFLSAALEYLRVLPDFQELELVEKIRAKSRVVPLGINLKRFDPWLLNPEEPATLLWNHRWEYDKNPDDFFQLLFQLKAEKIDFRLNVLGENFRKSPSIFAQAKEKLAEYISHFGYTESFKAYAGHLWGSDIIPVTSKQDFFGISAVEAIYCNCFPLLPNRLAFPGHIPSDKHHLHLYQDKRELKQKLKYTIQNIKTIRTEKYQHFVSRYDWCNLSTAYDEAFEQLIAESAGLHNNRNHS